MLMRPNATKTVRTPATSRQPKLGRLVVLSLALHLLIFGLMSGVILPPRKEPPRPVYRVNLVHRPVKDPQAGRPDAAVSRKKPPQKPKTAPKAAIVPKKAPVKKAPVKKAPPATKKAPVVTKKAPAADPGPSYEEILSRIEKTRPKEKPSIDATQSRIDELRNELAALATSELAVEQSTISPVPEAPAGMPQGRGTQAGVSEELWLGEHLKRNWSLSRYQLSRLDLVATVKVVYDAGGNLLDYRFLTPSGNRLFDDSVKKAILKDKKLPVEFAGRMEVDVEFNLKELAER